VQHLLFLLQCPRAALIPLCIVYFPVCLISVCHLHLLLISLLLLHLHPVLPVVLFPCQFLLYLGCICTGCFLHFLIWSLSPFSVQMLLPRFCLLDWNRTVLFLYLLCLLLIYLMRTSLSERQRQRCSMFLLLCIDSSSFGHVFLDILRFFLSYPLLSVVFVPSCPSSVECYSDRLYSASTSVLPSQQSRCDLPVASVWIQGFPFLLLCLVRCTPCSHNLAHHSSVLLSHPCQVYFLSQPLAVVQSFLLFVCSVSPSLLSYTVLGFLWSLLRWIHLARFVVVFSSAVCLLAFVLYPAWLPVVFPLVQFSCSVVMVLVVHCFQSVTVFPAPAFLCCLPLPVFVVSNQFHLRISAVICSFLDLHMEHLPRNCLVCSLMASTQVSVSPGILAAVDNQTNFLGCFLSVMNLWKLVVIRIPLFISSPLMPCSFLSQTLSFLSLLSLLFFLSVSALCLSLSSWSIFYTSHS